MSASAGTDITLISILDAYRASKTLAERAAWNFIGEHTVDGVAPFDISTINPPLIFGPVIHSCTSAAALNTSVAAFYAYLTGAKKDADATVGSGSWVDVRDVAQLHIEALVVPEASNLRFSVSNCMYSTFSLLGSSELKIAHCIQLLCSINHGSTSFMHPRTLTSLPLSPKRFEVFLERQCQYRTRSISLERKPYSTGPQSR